MNEEIRQLRERRDRISKELVRLSDDLHQARKSHNREWEQETLTIMNELSERDDHLRARQAELNYVPDAVIRSEIEEGGVESARFKVWVELELPVGNGPYVIQEVQLFRDEEGPGYAVGIFLIPRGEL